MSGKEKNRSKSKTNNLDLWRSHDLYVPGISCKRTVTRSQTPFNRIKHTQSDLELFADSTAYHPPGFQHLIETLKGLFGAIPRTIVTRSCCGKLIVDKELCKKVDNYKKNE